MGPPTPNSVIFEKKFKFMQNFVFVGLNDSLHMIETHGKLNHDYITGSYAHEHDYLGSTKVNTHIL